MICAKPTQKLKNYMKTWLGSGKPGQPHLDRGYLTSGGSPDTLNKEIER